VCETAEIDYQLWLDKISLLMTHKASCFTL